MLLPKKLNNNYEEYCENYKKTNEILKDVTIDIENIGEKEHDNIFKYKKGISYKYLITIKRNDKTINFEYIDSINNYETGYFDLDNFLYSILSCVKMDYYIPDSFKEFCDEFGYNTDSIKDRKLFFRCVKQAKKIKKIFNEDEISNFPS